MKVKLPPTDLVKNKTGIGGHSYTKQERNIDGFFTLPFFFPKTHPEAFVGIQN